MIEVKKKVKKHVRSEPHKASDKHGTYYRWKHWGRKFYYGEGKKLATAKEAKAASEQWVHDSWKGYGN